MKCGNSNDLIHKDVVVIGNGPSGIALSYMLCGHIPYVTSTNHPDELLSIRLESVLNSTLIDADLAFLANGLEGRTTNPVSLLLDNLIHPGADIGLEYDSLIEWRNNGQKIDHVVLGKGPAGGSWHSMDPEILTLSLASWMSLPGKRFESRNGSEKRATAKSVAQYYDRYVKEMGLQKYFRSEVFVTRIQPFEQEPQQERTCSCPVKKLCSRMDREVFRSRASLRNSLNYLLRRGAPERCHKRSRGQEQELLALCNEQRDTSNGGRYKCKKKSCQEDDDLYCDRCNRVPQVPNNRLENCCCDYKSTSRCPQWIVETVDLKTKAITVYTCNQLILANGTSDLPNRLSISTYEADPYWLLHDLRSLEIELDIYLQHNADPPDPVLVVGAGLSAADAIIATKGRNVPVLHLFRNKTDVTKQLPENMYPEYHKVHQMMKDGTHYPSYTPLAEHSLTKLDEKTHTATITSKDGKVFEVKLSFAIVLIGSRPDFRFLPENYNLGVKKQLPIDGKKNTVNIDKLTHSVKGHPNLYAIGPLAGDNFVRFLPGGALTVLCDLYKYYGYKNPNNGF